MVLLHEPARYPVAYFPKGDLVAGLLHHSGRTTSHRDLGPTAWYAVRVGDREAPRGAWEHTDLPGFAEILGHRVAFAWHAMDAFYEEDERILGHAADAYHRIDIRQTSRELIVQHEAVCAPLEIQATHLTISVTERSQQWISQPQRLL